MKSYKRILLLLLSALFLTILLSPWVAALWNFIIGTLPKGENYRYPFSRIFNRLFMITTTLLFLTFRRHLKLESLKSYGLGSLRQGYRNLLAGFFLALASMIVLVIALVAADIFTPYFRLAPRAALERVVGALLSAFTVGLLEELFFRAILFRGLLQDAKWLGALLITNFFYAAVHFIRPAEKVATQGIDAAAGMRHVVSSFQPFLDPLTLFPGLFGLFLIGLVLSYAFLRTESLYLSIGLHAGWIFGIKTVRVYGDYRREELGWLFGSSEPKLVSGVAGWIGIIAVGVIIHFMTRKREQGKASQI
jgi:membrane protease YdiL (CAAX protease family)